MFRVPEWKDGKRKRQQKSDEVSINNKNNHHLPGRSHSTLRRRKTTDYNVQYSGYIPREGDTVDILNVPEHDSASSGEKKSEYELFRKKLFTDYIATRKPCILRQYRTSIRNKKNIITTDASRYGDETILENVRWNKAPFSLKFMCQQSLIADTEVRVEQSRTVFKGDQNDRHFFGRGTYTSTTVKNFVDSIRESDHSKPQYYLTTQNDASDEDGRPSLISNPLLQMFVSRDHPKHAWKPNEMSFPAFPLRPSIMGNLVPSNINLWIGGSLPINMSQTDDIRISSGLHHDFHDNLYTLLRGEKTFYLFPPSDIECMYPYGESAHVYSNGLICYNTGKKDDREGTVEEDGWNDSVMKEIHKRMAVRKRFESAERNFESSSTSCAVKDDEMDQALQEMLDLYREEDYDEYSGDIDREKKSENCLSVENGKRQPRFGDFPPSFSKVGSAHFCNSKIMRNYPRFKDRRQLVLKISEGDSLYLPWYVGPGDREYVLSTTITKN